MKITKILYQDIDPNKNKPTEVKKELSVKKLVQLANARAAKLAKLNVKDSVKTSWNFTFNSVLLPLFNFYLKIRNNFFYRLFRLIGKIYLALYILTLIIAFLIFNYDQYSHAVMFIKFQRELITEVKNKMYNIFNYFRKVLTGYEHIPEPKGWNSWSSDFKAKVKDFDKINKILDTLKDNPYQSDRELFFNRNLFNNEAHWYDFYKSPWFYIPVTTIATGALIYYNADSIKELGSKIVLPSVVTTVISKVWSYIPSMPFRRLSTTLPETGETLFSTQSSRTSEVGLEDSRYFSNPVEDASKVIQGMEQQLAESDERAKASRDKLVAVIEEMKSIQGSLLNNPIVPSTPIQSTSKLSDVISPVVDIPDDGSEQAWSNHSRSQSPTPGDLTSAVEKSPS